MRRANVFAALTIGFLLAALADGFAPTTTTTLVSSATRTTRTSLDASPKKRRRKQGSGRALPKQEQQSPSITTKPVEPDSLVVKKEPVVVDEIPSTAEVAPAELKPGVSGQKPSSSPGKSSGKKSSSATTRVVARPPLPEELFSPGAARTDASRFPVPSETSSTDSVDEKETAGTIALPKFDTLKKRKAERAEVAPVARISRGDSEQYRQAIEVDPNADTNLELFEDKPNVDFVSILLGQDADTFFGIESGYLQLGHGALFLVIILAATVYEPSFPLTNLPDEYRNFLKQGLALTSIINVGVAVLSVTEAQARKQPSWFWAAKSLLIGGVALNQLRTGTGAMGPKSK